MTSILQIVLGIVLELVEGYGGTLAWCPLLTSGSIIGDEPDFLVENACETFLKD